MAGPRRRATLLGVGASASRHVVMCAAAAGRFVRSHLGVALAVGAAFAGALAVTFAATGGRNEPEARAPVGSLAVPIERSAPGDGEVALGSAKALPTLGRAEALPALAVPEARTAPAEIAPAPAVRASAPARQTPAAQAPAVSASPPPAAAPPPEPVAPAPPPEPVAPGPPSPEPAPGPAPAAPAPAPDPPPVEFDDSG
jgi:hypothetical protein